MARRGGSAGREGAADRLPTDAMGKEFSRWVFVCGDQGRGYAVRAVEDGAESQAEEGA